MSQSKERLDTGIRRVDWRGWIALAWALFWGVQLLRNGGPGTRSAHHRLVQAAPGDERSAHPHGIDGPNGRSSVPASARPRN